MDRDLPGTRRRRQSRKTRRDFRPYYRPCAGRDSETVAMAGAVVMRHGLVAVRRHLVVVAIKMTCLAGRHFGTAEGLRCMRRRTRPEHHAQEESAKKREESPHCSTRLAGAY